MSTPIAMLTGRESLLVERPYRNGRVILSAVPLDNSWRTNLTDSPAFVPLAHELVYYLAGTRGSEINLVPGQPIRFKPNDESSSGASGLSPPAGGSRRRRVRGW